AKDVHTKTVLSKFAEEELKHKQALEDFNIENLKKQEIEIEEEHRHGISDYLVSTEEGLSEDSDFKDVLIYAAKREKKAFKFYSSMSKQVDDSELRKLFVWLAQEESKHKEDLEALFWEVMYS
ncbi:MAG: ferritin family protein, partial [Candidatus Scalindua sediminis]